MEFGKLACRNLAGQCLDFQTLLSLTAVAVLGARIHAIASDVKLLAARISLNVTDLSCESAHLMQDNRLEEIRVRMRTEMARCDYEAAGLSHLAFYGIAAVCNAQVDPKWEIHDRNRPVPRGGHARNGQHAGSCRARPHPTPSFSSTAKTSRNGCKEGRQPRQMEGRERLLRSGAENRRACAPRIPSAIASCTWNLPNPIPPKGEDQDRGNSGVFLMGLYEIQVLDSYNSKTYADGQASAVYGQYPPLVNASRAPGQWQTYDIIWHGPRFDADRKIDAPRARHRPSQRSPDAGQRRTHRPNRPSRPPAVRRRAPDKLPLALQDHNHPVRYRNIWIRNL